jgi:predicted RNA-binding Zn ribbon-like protein
MSDFVFVSGRLCLDLAGTMLWRRTLRTELLDAPGDLRRWIGEAELVDAPDAIDARALARAKRLREAVYELARSPRPDAVLPDAVLRDVLAEVNDCARLPLPKLQIDANARLTRTGGIDEVLGAVARDAVELLGSPQHSLVKECANPDCTRLFVDLSRSKSRRWCGMAECGNRHKAASYRQRKRQHD